MCRADGTRGRWRSVGGDDGDKVAAGAETGRYRGVGVSDSVGTLVCGARDRCAREGGEQWCAAER